jgi:hypothetical protein
MQQENTDMSKTKFVRKVSTFKRGSFSAPQLIIFVIAFALIGYLIYRSFAAAPVVATLEAEQMVLPSGAFTISDSGASSGKAVEFPQNGTATGDVYLASSVASLNVIARGDQCSGAPVMTFTVDGSNLINNVAVSSSSWAPYSYTLGTAIGAGNHHIAVSFNNDYTQSGKTRGNSGKSSGGCSRNLYVDVSNFFGPDTATVTPAPTVSLSASPTSVTAGQSSTLTWASSNATSCSATGAWSGSESTSGSASTGALNQNSTYTLTCSGSGGSASATATVSVTASTPTPSATSIYWGALLDGNDTYATYYGNPAPNGQSWQDSPWGNTGNTWDRFESNAGKKMSIIHWGQPNPWNQTTFYGGTADIAYNRGAINMIDMSSGSTSLTDIANGVYDSQIKTWANNVKAWGKPFMLRWDWEMNGSWYDYGKQAAANPSAYVNSWKHFHDVVAAQGANNVTWVWCPNTEFSGSTSLSSLYPGDSYVDWTCVDGYNKSTSTYWLSFAQLFGQTYKDILALSPNKPMMIGETGSREVGGSKAAWITDAFTTQLPQNFPKIKAVMWFNWRIYENSVYEPWPIESSSAATAAFKSAISGNSYYAPGSSSIVNLPALTKVPPLQ